MAKPNISLLGATYSGVAGVTLPTSGGGTATFPWVEGSETKTANGTYDVTSLAQLVVNVAGGGGGLVYETGTYTPTQNESAPTISFANSHTSRPILVGIAETDGTNVCETSSNLFWIFFSWYDAFGTTYKQSASDSDYARYCFGYKSSSGVSVSSTSYKSASMSRITNTGFTPYTASSSRYWRKNHAYKWIAVWKP